MVSIFTSRALFNRHSYGNARLRVYSCTITVIWRSTLQPMTLTGAEMRTIDNLADSLFTVALSEARRRATLWPPASYSQNSKQHKYIRTIKFRFLVEVVVLHYWNANIQNLVILTFLIWLNLHLLRHHKFFLLFVERGDCLPGHWKVKSVQNKVSCMHVIKIFWLLYLLMTHTEQAGLDSQATMDAVRNENACNPIVRSVARSYISVAERYEFCDAS